MNTFISFKMCGILGEIQKHENIDLEQFNKRRDLLFHRGSDGFGTEVLGDGNITLGHRRLSIIDLSENGNQPLCNEGRTIWMRCSSQFFKAYGK